jgi:hypothetical protein
MKLLITAALLTIAAPAFAQADPHAGHHQQGQHEGHEQHKSCCEQKDADGTRKDCCEKMKDGKPMDCCEEHAKKTGGDAPAGHDMSKH